MNKQVVDTYKIMHVINQSINPPRDALVKVVVLVENWNNPTAFVYQSFFTKFGSYVVDDIKITYKLWNIEKNNLKYDLYQFLFFSVCENLRKLTTYARNADDQFWFTAFSLKYTEVSVYERGLSISNIIYWWSEYFFSFFEILVIFWQKRPP